ncbi:MAG: SIS domain-containing protein [Holosporales bacterium]|jgi:D-sedoheptulose 7-phosphate isomerase|nr:SIS domain-containing protein [Holosporales bacterium]
MPSKILQRIFQRQASLLERLRQDAALAASFESAATMCAGALQRGRKILLAGNGGSAADAQHWAAELVVRFQETRAALPALALSTDSSVLTAIGNDLGFEHLFSRQVEALGQEGDVLIVLTTSGRSPNISRACQCARTGRMSVVSFTSTKAPQEFLALCDVCLQVPSEETARIQEVHALLGHALCEFLESSVSNKGKTLC